MYHIFIFSLLLFYNPHSSLYLLILEREEERERENKASM